jgi:hypothetical protein
LDSERLAVSGGCHRFVFWKDGWLEEYEFTDESEPGLWCIANGDLVTPAIAWLDRAAVLVGRSMLAKHIVIC